MKLIVGLGNPGVEYQKNRHNVGFMAVDYYWEKQSTTKMTEKFSSFYGKIVLNGETFIFIKPQTYMNLSGKSVKKWMDFYKIAATDVFVVYDDLDISFGSIKLKTGGSAAGHNGIKSLIQSLQTEKFHRIRIGISRPPKFFPVERYVLGDFSTTDFLTLTEEIFPKVADVVDQISEKQFHDIMTIINQKRG